MVGLEVTTPRSRVAGFTDPARQVPLMFCFERSRGLQKSYKTSTETFHIPFIQLFLMLTSYHVTMIKMKKLTLILYYKLQTLCKFHQFSHYISFLSQEPATIIVFGLL